MQNALGMDASPAAASATRGGARPARVSVERRSVRKIRFSAAEWRLIEERARACGRAPARYVREVALDAVPKASRRRANGAIIRELGAIATSLQDAKRVLLGGTEAIASAATG